MPLQAIVAYEMAFYVTKAAVWTKVFLSLLYSICSEPCIRRGIWFYRQTFDNLSEK